MLIRGHSCALSSALMTISACLLVTSCPTSNHGHISPRWLIGPIHSGVWIYDDEVLERAKRLERFSREHDYQALSIIDGVVNIRVSNGRMLQLNLNDLGPNRPRRKDVTYQDVWNPADDKNLSYFDLPAMPSVYPRAYTLRVLYGRRSYFLIHLEPRTAGRLIARGHIAWVDATFDLEFTNNDWVDLHPDTTSMNLLLGASGLTPSVD